MKLMKYSMGIIIFLISTSFSTYKKTATTSIHSLMEGYFDTWVGDYRAEIFLRIKNDSISSFEIKEILKKPISEEKPLIGIFDLNFLEKNVDSINYQFSPKRKLDSLNTEFAILNKVKFSQAKEKTIKKIDKILQIHISPNFSQVDGGEVMVSCNADGWKYLKLYLKKDKENIFRVYHKVKIKDKEIYRIVKTLYVEFNWRFKMKTPVLR